MFLFSPGSARSHCYNPLDFVRSQPGERATDLQKIAEFLVPRASSGTPMWQNEAKALFVGLLSYVLESELYRGRRRIGEVLALLRTQEDTAIVLSRVLDREPYLPRLARDSLSAFINKAEGSAPASVPIQPELGLEDLGKSADRRRNERERFRSEAAAAQADLDLHRRPAHGTGGCAAPAEPTRPTSRRRHDASGAGPRRAAPSSLPPRRVPGTGPQDPGADRGDHAGGRRLRDEARHRGAGPGAELDHLYEESGRNVLLANAAHQLVLAANDHATATFVSEALGRRTIRYMTTSRQQQSWDGLPRVTRQEHVKERSLMMPEEVRRMDPNRFVLLTETDRPVFGTKLRHFETAPFKEQVETARQAVPDIPELVLATEIPPPPTLPGAVSDPGSPNAEMRERREDTASRSGTSSLVAKPATGETTSDARLPAAGDQGQPGTSDRQRSPRFRGRTRPSICLRPPSTKSSAARARPSWPTKPRQRRCCATTSRT